MNLKERAMLLRLISGDEMQYKSSKCVLAETADLLEQLAEDLLEIVDAVSSASRDYRNGVFEQQSYGQLLARLEAMKGEDNGP